MTRSLGLLFVGNKQKKLLTPVASTKQFYIVCFFCLIGTSIYIEWQQLSLITPPSLFPDEISNSVEVEKVRTPLPSKDPPYSDFTWDRFCKDKPPCIALLSASHHGGVESKVDPKTLQNRTTHTGTGDSSGSDLLAQRILLRQGYCAMYGCDVIVDYNQYNQGRNMWISDHGNHKNGPMPPHWNKVAALQRWLPHFDAILLLDMDTIWVDFNSSIYHLYESTSTIFFNGGVGLVLFKKEPMGISQCVVDSWWYHGTSPGCRYFKYPQNHKGQSQNLDMPWFWYSLLKCTEAFEEGESYECLNPCNGPENYVDHLMKDPNYNVTRSLWIHDCYGMTRHKIRQYTMAVESKMFLDKHLNLEMQWGNSLNFSESIKNSLSVHCKDSVEMANWLNHTVEVLHDVGCTVKSCNDPNIQMMRDKLPSWSQTQF